MIMAVTCMCCFWINGLNSVRTALTCQQNSWGAPQCSIQQSTGALTRLDIDYHAGCLVKPLLSCKALAWRKQEMWLYSGTLITPSLILMRDRDTKTFVWYTHSVIIVQIVAVGSPFRLVGTADVSKIVSGLKSCIWRPHGLPKRTVNFTSFLILLELKLPEDQSVLTMPVDHHTVIGGLVVAMAVYAYRDMRGAFC